MTRDAAARVVVLGASGTLGARIVGLLRRELPSVRVVGACRHPETLATPEARHLDLDDPSGFASALAGARALVHAAGPFDHDAGPLVSACLEAGVDYLDLAEDPAFVAQAQSAAAAQAAPRARVVTGCSTVPGLVALLARRFAGQRDLASLDAHLSLGSRNPVSAGLLYGLLRPIGQPGPKGEPWFSQLVRFHFADGRERSFGRYPIALEKGVDLEGHTIPVRLFVGFDRTLLNVLLAQVGRLLPRFSPETLRRLCNRALPVARAARFLGGEEGRLGLVARDANGHELARLELHAEAEGLDVPASPVVWALRRLLESRDAPPPGATPLERLIEPGVALDWLRSHGYRVVERGIHSRW
jgi:hypothetical protein